jgi:hypothetical protein
MAQPDRKNKEKRENRSATAPPDRRRRGAKPGDEVLVIVVA